MRLALLLLALVAPPALAATIVINGVTCTLCGLYVGPDGAPVLFVKDCKVTEKRDENSQ